MAAVKQQVEDGTRMQAVTFAVLVITYLRCAAGRRGCCLGWRRRGCRRYSAAAPALQEPRPAGRSPALFHRATA